MCGSFVESILQVSAARVSVVAVFPGARVPKIVLIPGVRVPESIVLIMGARVLEYYMFPCARTTGAAACCAFLEYRRDPLCAHS